jgi:hypothetical protein
MGKKENKCAKDYLEEELEKICLLEATTQPELKISTDEALAIYKQIQNELIPQEYAEYTDEQLSEIFESGELIEKLNQEDIFYNLNKNITVICPLCQKSNLVEDKSSIICQNVHSCNFKIDIRKTNVDLFELARRLDYSIAHHECDGVPHFQFKTSDNSNDSILFDQLSASKATCFLLMTCDKCSLMEFVI